MKRLSKHVGIVLAASILGILLTSQSRGQTTPPAQATMPAEDQLARVDFRDVPLADALRLLAGVSGDNIVASAEASKTRVSMLLRNVLVHTAIEELCKTNDLYQQRDPQTGITRILTSQEFQRQLGDFREQKTQVFTLLYPNAVDVAYAIYDLYGDRVQLSVGAPQDYDTQEIQERLNRFDLVDQRGQIDGLGSSGGNTNTGNATNTNNNSSNYDSSNNRSGSTSNAGNALRSQTQQNARNPRSGSVKTTENLAALRAIENATTPEEHAAAIEHYQAGASLGANGRNTDIFVTVARRNNLVIVRTGDPNTLAQIGNLIQQMDVPTPLVLLEVKVLSIDLADSFSSAFDWQFTDRMNWAGGFSSGNIQAPLSDALPASGQIPINIGGTGVQPNALTFQFVSSNFRARLQMLEDKNRVTSLAAPLLLTANNEVSRLFVGQKIPIITGYSSSSIVSTTSATTTIPPSPQTQVQSVGTTLLLTPSINSDRTVTLRLLQETSSVNTGGANIPFVATNGTVTNLAVDVVQSRAVSGTVVAKDGLMIAIGGLIQEQVSDQRQEVPILGRIPLLGMLFRDQKTGRSRNEMIILVRPFVLSTPAESQQISRKLTEELSINPKIQDPSGTLNTYQPEEVLYPNPSKNKLQKIFQFHSVAPADY
jgi:general secretion pathway protein D